MSGNFVNEIVPFILKSVSGKYRVKGGRAHLAYFLSLPSTDWDIECTSECQEEIKNKIISESKKYNVAITIEFRKPFNSYHLTIDGDDEPFMDLLIIESFFERYQLSGIWYMSLQDHIDDLISTCQNRESILDNFRTTLRYNIVNIHSQMEKRLSIDLSRQREIDLNPHVTIKEIEDIVISKLIQLSNDSEMEDIYRSAFKKEGKKTVIMRDVFTKKMSPDRYQIWLKTHYPIIEIYDQLVYSATLSDEFYQKCLKISSKYTKSQRRLDDIKNIECYIFSFDFQNILNQCQNFVHLFNFDNNSYFLDCYSKSIIKLPLK
jgi:hypothetical protein